MQASFVNIGLDRTAFLYIGDVIDPQALASATAAANDPNLTPEDLKERTSVERRPIEKLLKEGQTVVVQVAKEPLGTKGARVTMFLSIPGRYLVYMPDFNHIGVSRRIEDDDERKRLTDIVSQIKPVKAGVIIRTAAKSVDSGELQKDLKYLVKLGRSVNAKIKRTPAPSMIFQDLGLITKTTRDLYSEEVRRIVIDHEEAFSDLQKFLSATIPKASKKLELYDDKTPIFDVYGIEMDIGKALGARVDLPSGGYLIIDQAEALTSFDVNTGRFVGQLSAQDTILRTNLEAVKQVVAQLRVRNIGGIIVIDFIDMENQSDRDNVYETLQLELKKDKSRTNVLKISELGLVQMTRKRTSESLERQLMEPCLYCDGRGSVRSTASEAYDLLRELCRHAVQTGQKRVSVKVRKDISDYIQSREALLFESIKKRYKLKVNFQQTDISLKQLSEAPYEVLTQN
jgi:ribonuclease G